MRELLEKICEAIYEYGKAGAGMASHRGIYEASVPTELQAEVSKE